MVQNALNEKESNRKNRILHTGIQDTSNNENSDTNVNETMKVIMNNNNIRTAISLTKMVISLQIYKQFGAM